jgi:hypothetical protein
MSWFTGLFGWLGSLFGFSTPNTAEVVKIQASAVKLCGFLPTVETIIALMGAVTPVPGVGLGVTISKKICAAVTKSNAVAKIHGAGELKPEVDGVIIEGEFIK